MLQKGERIVHYVLTVRTLQHMQCSSDPFVFLFPPYPRIHVQEEGVNKVKRLMEFEPYDVDEVKSRLGEVLDEFIENLE